MQIRITTTLFLVHAAVVFGGDAGVAAAEEQRTARSARVASSDSHVQVVVTLQDDHERALTGRILIEAADGGLLLEADDGMLSLIERRQVLHRERLEKSFTPVTSAEMAARLLAEFPAGFRTHATPHYVVCYNTSRAYAQWTSSLLERLYKAFTNYWQNQGIELHEPVFPLAVILFADRQTYEQSSRDDLPGGVGNIVGFYSLRSNRINMFDLSGVESLAGRTRAGALRRGSVREISQVLSQPAAVPLVATIVHEATHQIAFNCGLQTRFADIPLWLCEGMAVYFEAPDLTSTRGWRGIGRVNYPRLTTFRENLNQWREGSLVRLLRDDSRFRNPQTALGAYADAWALNYFLIKYHPQAYAAYLQGLATKRPLVEDDPQSRVAEFRQHFGDLGKLEAQFLEQMSRLR